MALSDKKGVKENRSDAPSICCFSFSCVSITKWRRSYTSYDFKTLRDRRNDGISNIELVGKA